MSFNINDFKTALSQGGARANLFEVTISTPPVGSLSNFKFLCKTTTIPTSVIAPISIPFMGRDIKMAGDRTFDTWSTTIINDEDFGIRNVLERWLDHIKSHTQVKQKGKYKRTATVTQLDKQGEARKSYRFINAWPNAIGDTPLDWGTDGLQEITLTFSYDYWTHTALASSSATSLASLKLEGVSGSVPF